MGFNEEFTIWLQQELDLRNWSRSDLARKAGISHQTVSAVFNFLRAPGPEVCNGIAAALKIPPRIIHIKAGLIPAEKDRTPLLEELDYKAALLPPEKQRIILDLVNGMIINDQRSSNLPEKGGDSH